MHIRCASRELLYVGVTSRNIITGAFPAVFGVLMDGTAFAVYICRAHPVARQKAQPGDQECTNCLTLECSRCSAARTFWVWVFLKCPQSYSPCHLQKLVRQLRIPVLEDGEREITKVLV